MYCQNCGHKVADDDSFCVNCGARLSGSASVEMDAANADTGCDTVVDDVARDGADTEDVQERMPHLAPIAALKQMFENRPGDIKCGEVVLSKDIRQDEAELKIKACASDEVPLALFGSYEKGDFKGVLVTDKKLYWNIAEPKGRGKWRRDSIPHEEITSVGIIDTEDENMLCVNDRIVGLFATDKTGITGKLKIHDRALSGAIEYFSLTTPNPITLNTNSRPIEWMLNGSLSDEMPVAYATWAIVALCILGFAIQLLTGSFESDHKLVKVAESFGAEVPVWGWLVCGFLHGDIFQIGLNLACLTMICPTAERIFGMKFFASLYLASVLCSGALVAQKHPDVLSVGAGGGLYGVMAAVYTFGLIRYFLNSETFHDYDRRRFWKCVKEWGGLLLGNLLCTAKFAKGVNIVMAGYLGGMIAGIVCGIVALAIIPKRKDAA